MVRLRSLAWLIAVCAFVFPSLGISIAPSHAMAPAGQTAAMDCPDHAPPPDCPAEGTAKHAAGECCPLMTCVVALLAPVALAPVLPPLHARVIAGTRSLIGLVSPQDPPPPRS